MYAVDHTVTVNVNDSCICVVVIAMIDLSCPLCSLAACVSSAHNRSCITIFDIFFLFTLSSCYHLMSQHCYTPVLNLQVLYVDFAPGAALDALMQLGAATVQHFKAAAGGSLAIDEGGRSFTPHVTVAKASRMINKRRKGVYSAAHIEQCNSVQMLLTRPPCIQQAPTCHQLQ
jgi:hypothetical protein